MVKVNSCYAYFVDEIKSISRDIITKPDVRKNILKTEKRRFNCLKQGHLFSDCRSNLKCFKCDGNQHVAVCTFKPTKKEDTDDSGNQANQTANNYASSSFKFLKTTLYYYKLQERMYFQLTKGKQTI